MKSIFLAAALGLALTFSVTGRTAETAPANKPMPVLFQAEKNGPTFPVYAQKDGAYYQVQVYPKGQPFFVDAQNKFHFVNKEDGSKAYEMVYVSGNNAAPTALPNGKSDEEAKDILASGNGQAKDHTVCWGRRGWYSYNYFSYNNFCYYPRYDWGWNAGWGGYGWNTWGNPYYYSGYGCVLNNYWW